MKKFILIGYDTYIRNKEQLLSEKERVVPESSPQVEEVIEPSNPTPLEISGDPPLSPKEKEKEEEEETSKERPLTAPDQTDDSLERDNKPAKPSKLSSKGRGKKLYTTQPPVVKKARLKAKNNGVTDVAWLRK